MLPEQVAREDRRAAVGEQLQWMDLMVEHLLLDGHGISSSTPRAAPHWCIKPVASIAV
jgi:hypothetical protein